MKYSAYIAVTIDGYIADKNGGVDWLNSIPNPEKSDFGFADFMQNIDALLMGSNTFKIVESFGSWPYKVPVFVATNSIKILPNGYEDKIILVNGEIEEIIADLAEKGYENIYVDGGKMIESFLKKGLLDELVLTRIPIILGDGISLFPLLEKSVNLEHKKTEVLGAGLVKSFYKILE